MTNGGSGGYGVVPSELSTHATAVRRVADELGQALSAAEQVTVGVQAYGMICGPLFVPIVLAVSAPGLVTLKLAQQAVTSVSDAVTKAATAYENAEQAHSATLRSFGQALS
ncbi:MAG TPA: type VII secretion target [Amycolatopsis sp.]|nr:type VII secretion target [Amycolatopsis sp.]